MDFATQEHIRKRCKMSVQSKNVQLGIKTVKKKQKSKETERHFVGLETGAA